MLVKEYEVPEKSTCCNLCLNSKRFFGMSLHEHLDNNCNINNVTLLKIFIVTTVSPFMATAK